MSSVELRVELPAYSHSFSLHIPSDGTVLNIKQEISRICPGNPCVESQKLVWRGRYLTDGERVNDLWKSPDEPRIVHLAVRPSGWSGAPPSISPVPSTSASSFNSTTSSPLPMPPHVPRPTQNIRTIFDRLSHPRSSEGSSIEYIQWKHDNAICALMYGWTSQWHNAFSIHAARLPAVMFARSRGFEWPSVLDEEFPAPTPGGIKYEYKIIDGLPHLSLSDSTSTPTPFQLHAIKILSYTFTLLSLNNAPPPPIRPVHVTSIPANAPLDLNVILQQLGLPPLQVQQPLPINDANDRIIRELREIAARPFLVPLVFLIFRTCLLLYFIAPASKLLFGALVLAWLLLELWVPMRNTFLRNLRRIEEQQRQNVPGGVRAGENGVVGEDRQQHGPQPQAAPPRADGAPIPVQGAINGGSLLDVLANMNLNAEQQILAGMPAEEPSFWRKSLTFLALLITTVHPAVWNRRRSALRRREGQLRTHANVRNTEDEELEDGEDEIRRRLVRNQLRDIHNLRPQWVRRYIDRVAATDWLEDID